MKIPPELQSKIERDADAYGVHIVENFHSLGTYKRADYKACATPYAVQLAKAVEALQKIDKECARHDTTAWSIACDALDNYEAWLKGE